MAQPVSLMTHLKRDFEGFGFKPRCKLVLWRQIKKLFFLPRANKRMKQSGDSIRLFGAKDSFVHVSDILNREECMRIGSLDMISNPGYVHPVDKGEDHLYIPP